MVRSLPHNPVLVMDVFEGKAKGENIEKELSKYLTIVRQNLVPLGLGDYFWVGVDSLRYTLEHKTARELLSDMGNRLDTQLRKNTQNADDVGLIWNGIITPTRNGKGCYPWSVSKTDSSVMVRGKASPHSYQEVIGYIWSLEHNGISVYNVPDWRTMCRAIAEFVYNTLKPDHKTLRRYVKTKPIVLDPDVPEIDKTYIKTLMGISGARIGEITAKKILKAHKTPFNYMVSEIGDKPEISEALYRNTMRGIGREP
jgi:hypothetical protein